jgi:hypothetical protein
MFFCRARNKAHSSMPDIQIRRAYQIRMILFSGIGYFLGKNLRRVWRFLFVHHKVGVEIQVERDECTYS